MKKLILIYGAIAGLIVTAMLVFSFSDLAQVDFDDGAFFGYASMILAFSTIFIAIKKHRDNELDGKINFKKAMYIGLGITLVATFIYILCWMIMSETIAKDFMSEYYQYSVEKLKASDLSEAQINEKIAEMEKFQEMYKNPIVKIGMTFMEIFPVWINNIFDSSVNFKKTINISA